jgi:hypothetical protein
MIRKYINMNITEIKKEIKPIKTKIKYKCDTCNKIMKTSTIYKYHIKNNVCKKVNKLNCNKCNKCNKVFTDKRCLIYHIKHNVCINKINNINNNEMNNLINPNLNNENLNINPNNENLNINPNNENLNKNLNTNTNSNTNLNNNENSINNDIDPNNNTNNTINTTNNTNNGINIQTQNNQNNHINNININLNNTNDIQKVVDMIPFRNVKYNITPEKYLEYAKYPERAIKSFIKDEHLNPNKPERMNILNTNTRSNKVQVLDRDDDDEIRWMIKSKTDINELLYDRGVNHLYVAKNILEANGIYLDARTKQRLNDKINEYETDDRSKREQIDMISDLTYNYRDIVESNKKNNNKLIKN